MPSANDHDVFNVVESEMDTPLSVTLAIWYYVKMSRAAMMMGS
jgi:DNA-binding protein Fis